MKVTKKYNLKVLICLAALLAAMFVLAACDKYGAAHYDYLVTFNYNVVDANGNPRDDIAEQYLGVQKDSLISIKPGYSDRFDEVKINGYYVEGWYLAVDANEDGVPDRGADGKVVLGKKWDFAKDRVNENITLYANMKHSATLFIIDKAQADKVAQIQQRIEEGVNFMTMTDAEKEGYGIVAKTRDGDNIKKPTAGSMLPAKKGYTWLETYYTDPECTEVFAWDEPIVLENDVFLYVDFIEGSWSLIRTANDFIKSVDGTKKMWVMNDIDFTGVDYVGYNVNVEINGNGFTLRNIKLQQTATRQSTNMGLFKTIGALANIHDLNIDNAKVEITLNVSITTQVNIGFFAGEAYAGARLKNINVTASTYTFKLSDKFGHSAETSEWIVVNNIADSDIENVDHSDVTGETVSITD